MSRVKRLGKFPKTEILIHTSDCWHNRRYGLEELGRNRVCDLSVETRVLLQLED